MLKYVSKNFKDFKDFNNKHFYYCSNGLKRSESRVLYNCNDTLKNVQIIDSLKTILKTKNQKYILNDFFIKVCFNSKTEFNEVLQNVKGVDFNV